MRKLDILLKNKTIDISKLLELGFKKSQEFFIYEKSIYDDKFSVIIKTDGSSMTSKLIEKEFDEEYILVDVENAQGKFVGKIRTIYEGIINRIIDECTTTNIYTFKQSKEIIAYVKEKYNSNLEFLWEKFPEYAVLRNKNNNKWYGLIIKVEESKLGLENDDMVEVLNLKYPKSRIDKITDYVHYFPSYHMNKSNWISIKLDSGIPTKHIIKLLDWSYSDSTSREYWVFPANVKLFNIFNYFKENKCILWRQLVDAHIEDYVYIYVGAPYSAIMYKCIVRATRVNNEGHDALKLELIEEYSKYKYPLALLKENGITNIRGERKLPYKTVALLGKNERSFLCLN